MVFVFYYVGKDLEAKCSEGQLVTPPHSIPPEESHRNNLTHTLMRQAVQKEGAIKEVKLKSCSEMSGRVNTGLR